MPNQSPPPPPLLPFQGFAIGIDSIKPPSSSSILTSHFILPPASHPPPSPHSPLFLFKGRVSLSMLGSSASSRSHCHVSGAASTTMYPAEERRDPAQPTLCKREKKRETGRRFLLLRSTSFFWPPWIGNFIGINEHEWQEGGGPSRYREDLST